MKLLLEIGSEVDVIFKQYCGLIDPGFNGDKMDNYRLCISSVDPSFFTQEVSVNDNMLIIKPWNNINPINGDITSPHWWKAYNSCKHDRTGTQIINGKSDRCYKLANLEYTMTALAGLYQLQLFSYRILAINEGKKVLIPLAGSRFFKLIGQSWSNVQFFYDYAIYIHNGNLILENGIVNY